jgi:hypothetical protein
MHMGSGPFAILFRQREHTLLFCGVANVINQQVYLSNPFIQMRLEVDIMGVG